MATTRRRFLTELAAAVTAAGMFGSTAVEPPIPLLA